MPRRLISVGDAKLLFEVASYGRRGPDRRDHLSRAEIELIERTVRRVPEVMVKVLTRGGQDLKAVARHIAYLNRGGEMEIETDDGQRLSGKGVENELLEDWDLDLEEHRRTLDLESRSRRIPPKLVHKLMFSMPAGTSPGKVLTAVKNFAREEFGLKHRYAMVLHTDEPHPHVHMVVKALSEQGERLNIRRAALKKWRQQFAKHLRTLGVEANATERAVRGQTRQPKKNGIYRASLRGESTHMRERSEEVARSLQRSNGGQVEPGKAKLLETRDKVRRAWLAVSDILTRDNQAGLAAQVRQFLEQMPVPMTDREWLAEHARLQRAREGPSR